MRSLLSVIFIITLSITDVFGDEKNSLFLHETSQLDLTPEQAKIIEYLKSQKMNSRVTTVKVNTSAFTSPHINLNISSQVSIDADRKKVDSTDGTVRWLGELSDSPDSASFVIRGQNVTGTIQNRDMMYSIKPIGGGLHAIIEQNPKGFPKEHPPEQDKLEAQKPNKKDANINDIDPTNRHDSNTKSPTKNLKEISVLVVYTDAVQAVTVDPLGLIELAIKETNDSYLNSSIPLKANLAGTKRVNYSESDSFKLDLARLSNGSDEIMDDIHNLRNSLKADIVVMLINNSSYCGLADAILSTAETAFAIVFHGCATGYYSFAHEIGHLQGARHNPEADSANAPFKYGHGYINESAQIRTIMSYDCANGCRRLPYWSGPNVNYNGKSLGTNDEHNNTRVLIETAPKLSKFR